MRLEDNSFSSSSKSIPGKFLKTLIFYSNCQDKAQIIM
ncbi:MAG: hypothetical protein MRERC_1c019 [Mycoplasmataceae bacterium RC_NB112A]|nr:MAG: hypothetical protein MRERC_10c004 [Mycoplasmataceae bacterium RC_NB112A]KLL02440.1 MAG: hypothetical protein MRERC_1c019 [Mycoplasmataceae bacterium RC_NB112A]